MQAGQLVNQIILKSKSATVNERGGEVITYTPVATVAAAAQPVRGREYEMLHVAGSEIDIKFTIYYREDVQADWRVTWRGQEYEVVGPPIDVRAQKVWLELMCRTAQT